MSDFFLKKAPALINVESKGDFVTEKLNSVSKYGKINGTLSYYRQGLLADPLMIKKEWLQDCNSIVNDVRINFLVESNDSVFDKIDNFSIHTYGIGNNKSYLVFDLDRDIFYFIDSIKNIIIQLIKEEYYYKYSQAYDFGKSKFIGFKRIPSTSYNRIICISDIDELSIRDNNFKETDNGIIVPDKRVIKTNMNGHVHEHEVNYTYAIIVSIGEGEINRTTGERLPMDFKLLDKVIIPPNCGSFLYIDDIEYRCCLDWDIIGKL